MGSDNHLTVVPENYEGDDGDKSESESAEDVIGKMESFDGVETRWHNEDTGWTTFKVSAERGIHRPRANALEALYGFDSVRVVSIYHHSTSLAIDVWIGE